MENQGFLDFLTDEMEDTFVRGRQLWGHPDNYEAKKSLVESAFRRAELRFRVAVDDRQTSDK